MEHPLRIHRKLAGLSLDAVAAEAGFGKATLSRVENWKADPSAELIRKCCALFPDLQPNDFFVEARRPQSEPSHV